jgi:hypothetical protein
MNQPSQPKLKSSAMKPVTDARQVIGALSEALSGLRSKLKESGDMKLVDASDKMLARLGAGAKKLERPTITFASIGTTSSGKSTALNGIIGAKIAPMDANELSAGLLTLEHHLGDWELYECDSTGEIVGSLLARGEERVYSYLNEQMQLVVDSRQKKGEALKCKDYVVRGNLFVCEPDHPMMCELGEGVRIRIFDLPGLRTAQDSHNAPIIRERIKQAFSIVLIDRTGMFDHEKRAQLLKELDEIVNDLGGRDACMAFLFNKIDIPNPGGKSADQHLREAQADIRKNLTLHSPDKFELLPFSGILYYHTTRLMRAIASNNLTLANTGRDEILHDCGSQLAEYLERTCPQDNGSQEYVQWEAEDDAFSSLQKASRRNKDSDIDDLIILARLALVSSRHELLWNTLGTRIRDNINTVILYPILGPINKELTSELGAILTVAKAGQFATVEDLKTAQHGLQEYKASLFGALADKKDEFRGDMSALSNSFNDIHKYKVNMTAPDAAFLVEDAQAVYSGIIKKHGGSEHLTKLHTITKDLIQDILSNALRPFLALLMHQNSDTYRLDKQALRTKLRKESENDTLLMEVFDRLDQIRTDGYDAVLAKNGEEIKTVVNVSSAKDTKISRSLQDDLEKHDQKKKRADVLDSSRAALYLALRAYMSNYAERWLKMRLERLKDDFADMANNLMENTWEGLYSNLCSTFKGTIAFDVMPSRPTLPDVEINQIPAEVFSLPLPKAATMTSERTKVGTQSYEDGSCFTTTKQRAVEGEVTYMTRLIPTAGEMESEIIHGIHEGDKYFHGKLSTWMKANLINVFNDIEQQFAKLLKGVEVTLQERLAEIESDANNKIHYWQTIESEVEVCKNHLDSLWTLINEVN